MELPPASRGRSCEKNLLMLASRVLTSRRVCPTAALAFLALSKAADAPSAACTETPALASLLAWLPGTLADKRGHSPAWHRPPALSRSSGPGPGAQKQSPTGSEGPQIPSSGWRCPSAEPGGPAKIQRFPGGQNGVSTRVEPWRRLVDVSVAARYLQAVD